VGDTGFVEFERLSYIRGGIVCEVFIWGWGGGWKDFL